LLGRDTAGDWRENTLEIDTKLLGILYLQPQAKRKGVLPWKSTFTAENIYYAHISG
jgi:hypothetical protein